MKERFNIEIAGISFTIVSDDGEEFVRQTEAALADSVQAVLAQSTNFSKFDAVTLSALDFCGQAQKAEAKIRNLEAQIEILEANMRRLREENASDTAKDVPQDAESAAPAPAEEAEEAENTVSAKEDPADDSDGRDKKFRQLEALLGSQLKIDVDGNN